MVVPLPHQQEDPAHWSERLILALIVATFVVFTWRSATMFYTDDDLMNMNWAWTADFRRLLRAQVVLWDPLYRPLGQMVYRLIYANFD